MKTRFIVLLAIAFCVQGRAQFLKKLGDKAMEAAGKTVEKKVEEKSEKTASDTSDKLLNGKKKPKNQVSEEATPTENASQTTRKKSKKGKRHELLENGIFTPTAVFFDPGKSVLKPDGLQVIEEIGAVLADNPSTKITIAAYCDPADGKKKQELSEYRSMAIKTQLVQQFELNEDNIQIVIVKAQAENRRVEFKTIK